MLPYGDKLNWIKTIRSRKVKPLHAVLRQESSDTRQEDKNIRPLTLSANSYIRSFDFCPL